jgi:ABC-type nickel/cobalt efflux system permease component RcnA
MQSKFIHAFFYPMKTKTFFLLTLACLLFFTSIPVAHAHPADVYLHKINIAISQSNLQIKWDVKPGPMLTSFLWYQADADQDGTLTSLEADTWGRARAALLIATLDDKPLPLLIESVHMPADLQKFQAGEEFITFTLSASLPNEPASIRRLALNNGMEQKTSINLFSLSASGNVTFLYPLQKNNAITIDIVQDRMLITDQSKLISSWNSGMPSLPAGQKKDVVTQTAEQVVPELAKNSPQEILLNLVRTEDFSASFYIFALAVSLALGALHALTPGHGKTVVAAYLVGSRGTTKHAIALGSIVTLTHTGSVFIIGLFTLAASQYILPTRIIPLLEILSGLLIVGLGLYLFWQRFSYWRKTAPTAVPSGGSGSRKISLAPASIGKKITGKYKIQKLSGNYHDHGNGKIHSHDVPEAITWRSLITLGISGGLVPCPDAIAILLVAIAINRILLGLALIISFSFGLAVVLIVIGLLMVNGSRLFTRMDAFNKFAPIMPIVSAAIVLILGIGLTYGAVSKIGSFSSMAGADSKENEAQAIYLNADENKHKQLFIVDTQGSDPIKLTDTANGVVDFAISPDQGQIIYIEQTEDIEYNLWLMNLISKEKRLVVSCKTAVCGQPIWSPDGKRVVYEYMELDGGVSSLWWFDVASGKAQPVFQEARLPGTNPRWSPNGEWLSYAAPNGIRLYDLESSESRLIENILGAAVQWSPDSKSFLLRDVLIKQDQFITQLFLYDLSSETITNLNANENMENILAAWSPDGEFIAVVRRDLSIPRGDQIWLMRADGSDAHALTDMPAVLHGSLNWSPDGKYILYDLYLLDSFPLESQLEMVNIENGEITNLKVTGYNPKWVGR